MNHRIAATLHNLQTQLVLGYVIVNALHNANNE